jgi:ferric-dicitrate binding protein FerR (iron transport regulator)
VLSRHAPSISDQPPSDDARDRAIEAIDRAMARGVRTRRVAAWVAAGVAAAAAVALVFTEVRRAGGSSRTAATEAEPAAPRASPDPEDPIVAYPFGSGASLWINGTRAPLPEGGHLIAGSRVQTPPNGRASLAFATGTSAMLGEGADMTVDEDGPTQVLRLDAGAVELHVAKVSVGRRFLVATPDAQVEVRGTRFNVAIAPVDSSCNEEAVTHLTVSEGVVVVRHGGVERRVVAGEQWPGGCIPTIEISAPMPAAPAAPWPQPVVSSLGEQNDLFAEGIVAKHGRDPQAALSIFDRFLTTYPASPLAQSAAVERMRLLRTTSSPRAPAAARQYLARYPNGFARAEAEAIVLGAR